MTNHELNQPVTKQYLDEYTEKILLPAVSALLSEQSAQFSDTLTDQLGDLKGDLVVLMHKEDRKLLARMELLQSRKVISPQDAKAILTLEPFPKS